MNYGEIEKLATTYDAKRFCTDIEINRNIIKILNGCINNNIKLNITNKDLLKIMLIYYEFNHKYYDDFIKKVIELSINKIDLSIVLDMLLK